MKIHHNTWAVVLAGGEGTRLRTLTSDPTGQPVPKQYCSLFGRSTLLHDSLRRARMVAGRNRLCAVVAAQHAHWWQDGTRTLTQENLIVQPESRGTAIGILLPLLTLLKRDPDCRILFLPADHFVSNEISFACALLATVVQVGGRGDDVLLLGISPDEPDPEFGYIVPVENRGDVRRVLRFVEKPRVAQAAELIGAGALWNSFIFAARGATLLELFRARMPALVHEMAGVVERIDSARAPTSEIATLYAQLPNVDFCRDILPGAESCLRVIPAAGCGWTDLGTPRRVAEVVVRSGLAAVKPAPRRASGSRAPLNLTAQYAQRMHLTTSVSEAHP